MTKKQKITLGIAAIVIVALLVVCGVTGAAKSKVDCIDCHKAGYLDCADCVDEELGVAVGLVKCAECNGENSAECTECEGAGVVLCETCEGALTIDCETCEEGKVRGSLWALLPPVIAIGLALITKEVYSSLFIGIVSGALLYSDFSFTGSMDTMINDGFISAVAGTAGVFIFLVELGIIVALINKTGASAAFGRWAKTHIKTRVGATLATFFFGVLIFIDDYFNCLTVGAVMRPVTDTHKISRAKLAYIIDATAAPVCMIAPISSWAAAVSSYAPEGEGLRLFVSAIPFNFYSLLTFVFIFLICFLGFDYGSMRMYELDVNDEAVTDENEEEKTQTKGRVFDLVFPIIVLIVTSVFAILYVGGMKGIHPEGELGFVDAFGNTDATVALPWAGLITLVVTVAYYIIRKVISFTDSMDSVPKGFIAMVPAILILTFATALKNITGLLGAKYFIADMMLDVPEFLTLFFPALIFIVACFLAFSTGTSWGTFGILIPIVLYMFPDAADAQLQLICMSACLAGAVCGDHCSPISDTTIMSSAGAECDHLVHVSTQIPYALTVAGISFVMFVFAGFVQNAWICLPIGIALTVGTVFVIRMLANRKQKI